MNIYEKKQTNDEPILEDISTEVLEELREQARRNAREAYHDWVQRGPWLVCRSCENQHAVHIEVGKMFVGMKDGRPVFEDMFKKRK